MKKKLVLGATSWYHCVAEDSRISKMPVINPFQALVHPQQTQKNDPAWIVKPQPKLLLIRLFLVNRASCRSRIVDFNLPSD
jgi:hypothetical protein